MKQRIGGPDTNSVMGDSREDNFELGELQKKVLMEI